MNFTSFKNNFKAHPLLHTVTLSAGMHLIAFYFFSPWDSVPNHYREKVIKINYVLEKIVTPVEKKIPEFEKKIDRVMTQQEKTAKIIRPNTRPKSAIIRSVKVVITPPHPAKRNPVPIRNSKEIFKPVKPFQHQIPNPFPVAGYKRKAQFEVPQPIRPAPRITKTSSSMGTTILNSTVQIKYPKKVNLPSNHNSPSPASSTYNGKLSWPKTTAVQILLPVELDENLFGNQPVPEIENFRLKSLRGFGQSAGIQARVPKSLDSELLAQNQPVIPVARNYLSSQPGSTSLLQKASIPSGFSEEFLGHDKKLSNRAPAKTASLGGGVGQVSAELLGKIKKRFSTQIWSRIAQFKYYPRIARHRGFEGQPVVAFTLGNGGELLELSIANPSPFKLLDEAALDAVKSGSPYPAIPELLNMESIRFKVPIPFTLEDQ